MLTSTGITATTETTRTRDQNATPVDASSKKATVDRKSLADTVVDDKSNLPTVARKNPDMAVSKSPDMAVSKSHLVTVVKNNLGVDVAPASTVDVDTMMTMMTMIRTEVSDDMVVEDATMMKKTWTSTVSVAAATRL